MDTKEPGCQIIGKYIGQIHRHSCMYFAKQFSRFGIGHGQFLFLLRLYNNHNITQEELSKLLRVDKATTARAIKKLENEGYVERVQRENDKRSYNIVITDKAEKIKEDVYSIMNEWENKIKSCLSEKEAEELLLLLTKLNDNLFE